MLKRIHYLWRLITTGFSFLLFGLGSLIVWGMLFPLISPWMGQGAERRRRCRRLMHEVFRLYVGVLRFIGILSLDCKDRAALNRPGRIVISNHPSLLDIVLLLSVVRNGTCIVKPALFENPVMRTPIRAVRYLYASEGPALLDLCAEELFEGSSLIIFPEGTRSPAGEYRPFQRGAANIALRSGAPLLPVYIHCSPPTLKSHEKWYHVSPTRIRYRFHVGDEIDPQRFAATDERPLAARRLTRYLQDYFAEQARVYG